MSAIASWLGVGVGKQSRVGRVQVTAGKWEGKFGKKKKQMGCENIQ